MSVDTVMSVETRTRLDEVLATVEREVFRAMSKHAPMTTAHEGYAVILEELDELWDEIKRKQSERNTDKLQREAVQVAAMAIRFLVDLDGRR